MKAKLAIAVASLLPMLALADYLNPCGIIQGENAWFRMSIQPESFPDSKIVWTQSGAGSVSFPDGNTGRVVRVQGVACGDVKLEIQIGDAPGRRPCFHAKVVTNSVIGVSMWVVSNGTTPATTPERAMAMLERAALVWRQAGISFRLDDYCVTNRPEMLDVGFSSSNGDPSVYDVAALNPASGVLKVYFVNNIGGQAGNNGATVRSGILVATNATVATLSHEIGHSFGLKDIFATHWNTTLVAHGPVCEEMTPDDWNGGTGQRYYSPGTGVESLIPRMLMHGFAGDDRADITIGDVYGLWYSNRWNAATHKFEKVWQTTLAPVGFFRHCTGVSQYGLEQQRGGGNMDAKTTIMAAVLAGAGICLGAGDMSQCGRENNPPLDPHLLEPGENERLDPISDEEALAGLKERVKYEHDDGIDVNIFWRMGKDRERMTRVLIRSVEDARSRKYEHWGWVVQYSVNSLTYYGTKTAIPLLESVLTNDVCGAGRAAATAYVRLAGEDGRDFEFFKKHLGSGKVVPQSIGRVIYRTLEARLKDKKLPEDIRKEYTAYLLSRAECEKDILTGNMLDRILVETVPGYRDSERRKANLAIVTKPDPNQPHVIFRRNQTSSGASETPRKPDRAEGQ